MRHHVRSIIVDDEQPAINALNYQLNKFSYIEVLNSFTDVLSALAWLRDNNVDLVFLDIEMTKMTGVTLAKKIIALCPHVDIVFVTAHENYAVQAFELEAFDYIMKPVSEKRLGKTVQRYLEHRGKAATPAIKIQCFGQFMLMETDDPKWRTSKAKDLFAFLVHHRGLYVPKDSIIDSFWPDLDREKASNLLYTNLHNLRKMLADLGYPDVIIYSNGTYKVNREKLSVDVDEFLRVWKQIDSSSNITTDVIEAAVNRYRGDYFAMEGYEWAIETQSHLEHVLIDMLKNLTARLAGSPEKQERYLLKWLDKEPYSSLVYAMLFQLYAAKGDVTSLVKSYRTMTSRLRSELGVEPDPTLTILYNDLYKETFVNESLEEVHYDT